MTALFEEKASIEAWLEMERALAHAQGELGIIPRPAADAIQREATPDKIDISLLRERTRIVGYPILPLLEQIRAASSPDVGRYIHWGTTTQDVMDTGLALQMSRALDRARLLVDHVGAALEELARAHRSTLISGRTHARAAVPTTLGAKFAVVLAEFARHLERLHQARTRVATVQLFGAAGTAAALGQQSRRTRELLAQHLGLSVGHVPWHTARDSLAEIGFVLAAIAATCGKIGREVIDLSRPEIGELSEASGHLRGASSTMPQKANPIESETVVGLSVLSAQQASALLAAMQAGHERAAGEWQIEWDALPLAFAYGAATLTATARILEGLQIFPKRMRANLDADGGLIMAEAAMMSLAPCVGRDRAHDFVYEACDLVRQCGVSLAAAIREVVGNEINVSVDLEAMLEPAAYLGEAETIVDEALTCWQSVRGDQREPG